MPTTVYTWAKVDLPDPATYYYGFKEARVLSYGDINRALSDERGNYEGSDFSFEVADTDRLIRGLMAGAATKYGVRNRNVTMRMISDADRRLLKTPRTVARGITRSIKPLTPLKARFEMVDFVTSKFTGTNTQRQIPSRLLGPDFPASPIESKTLAAPIIYGEVSDEASATSPPTITGTASLGAYVEGGEWRAGFGPTTATVSAPTGVSVTLAAGGTLPTSVPNGEYGVIVTAVDSSGRESNPHVYYYDGPNGSRGSFADGPLSPTYVVTPSGSQKIQVSWSAVAGATKYRAYLGTYYYGARFDQFIEVNAPTTSCEFTTGPEWGVQATTDNITPGANLVTFFQSWAYVVMALMADGITGVSVTVHGNSSPYRRPVRVEWVAVPGAIEYRVARKSTGDFDRQWSVSAAATHFDDDLLDTGVTYLDGGLVQPRGAVPAIYVGEEQDDFGFVWSAWVLCGHAIVSAVPFLNGVRVDSGSYGVTWLAPGQTGYTTYFATSGTNGRYRDKNGNRYAIIYVRGPEAEAAKTGQITANVEGIETVGNGSGTVITDMMDQYLHFMTNWGIQDYASGSWLSIPTWAPDEPTIAKIDAESFTAASEIAAARITGGYVGAGVIGNKGKQESLRDWIARWNLSANVDAGFNRNSQFFVSMLDHRFSATTGAVHFTQLQDVIAGSLEITPREDRHFNVVPFSYRRRWREDTWEVTDDLQDATSIAGYLDELTADDVELWFVRDATTAEDVMQRRLLMSKDPPIHVTFRTPLVGFNTDIGDVILLTTIEGVGSNGWTRQALRILRQTLNPNDFSLRLECLSVDAIYTETAILGDDTWAVDWTTASTTQRQYLFLADEGTGEFSDGEPGKRLR